MTLISFDFSLLFGVAPILLRRRGTQSAFRRTKQGMNPMLDYEFRNNFHANRRMKPVQIPVFFMMMCLISSALSLFLFAVSAVPFQDSKSAQIRTNLERRESNRQKNGWSVVRLLKEVDGLDEMNSKSQ